MIKVGDRVPSATLLRFSEKGVEEINLDDLLKGKRVVLIGFPGAFTITCTKFHLPSIIEHHKSIKAKGIDEIIFVAVNDMFVLEAFERALDTRGKITVLSDWDASFTEAMGLSFVLRGLGLRSQRYNALVEDGVLKYIDVEEDSTECVITQGEDFLKNL